MTVEEIFNRYKKDFISKTPLVEGGKVIILYGPPCSGKTVQSKILSKKFNLHRVSLDLLRVHYFDARDFFTDKNNKEVFRLLIMIIEYIINKQESVVCEGLFLSNDRKTQIINIQKNTCFIYLTASLEVLKERLFERYKSGYNSEGLNQETLKEEQLVDFYALSQPPTNRGLIINTELYSLSQSSQIIAKTVLKHKLFLI